MEIISEFINFNKSYENMVCSKRSECFLQHSRRKINFLLEQNQVDGEGWGGGGRGKARNNSTQTVF